MILAAEIILAVLSLTVGIMVLLFAAQCLMGSLSSTTSSVKHKDRPRVAVLMPAHNEQAGISKTIEALLPQLIEGDRLIVIADNCDDRTAAIAESAGAEVIQRNEPGRRGKGYALSHGIEHLRQREPDVVVFMDADTIASSGTVDALAREAHASGRPVQAAYVFDLPEKPGMRDVVSAFAIRVKNVVRPLGLARCGMPCQLTGAGMAMPWSVAADMLIRKKSIVEDMEIGIDLAIQGFPPRFLPGAVVRGVLLNAERQGAYTQRERWEHGHLHTLLVQAPRLLAEGVKQRRICLVAMGLDLAIPPLSVLSLAWVTACILATATAALGAIWWPVFVLAIAGGFMAIAVMLAWARFGRDVVSLREMCTIPLYVAWKIPIYLKFLLKRQKSWIRTPRDETNAESNIAGKQ